MMDEVNGTKSVAKTPMDFVTQCIREYHTERNTNPTLILMSVDVLRDLSKQAKDLAAPGSNTLKYRSIMILLQDTIMFAGIEIAIVGGTKRFTLI